MKLKIKTTLVKGHGVASGKASNSPFPAGTISMQMPFFKKLGLDLTAMFPATLNLSISPMSFELHAPKHHFASIAWAKNFPSEDFSLTPCTLHYQQNQFAGVVYYPHPETKIGHFQPKSVIEVISSFIPDIQYGSQLELELDDKEIVIVDSELRNKHK